MAENEGWIEFDGKIKDIGNHGKSRGISLSACTNELDIGRHIVGKFKFVDSAPNDTEYLNRKKQNLLTKRIDFINERKTFCAQNKLSIYARKYGLPEEQALTMTNLDFYFAIWLQLDLFTSQETQQDPQLEKSFADITHQLQQLSIDVHKPFTLRGEDGVREQYSKAEYALDKELEVVVAKGNVATYKVIKAEYSKLKQQLALQSDKALQRNSYIESLTAPKYVVEAVVEDIDEGYTKNALSQLDKRVDAYIKDPQALMKRKGK